MVQKFNLMGILLVVFVARSMQSAEDDSASSTALVPYGAPPSYHDSVGQSSYGYQRTIDAVLPNNKYTRIAQERHYNKLNREQRLLALTLEVQSASSAAAVATRDINMLVNDNTNFAERNRYLSRHNEALTRENMNLRAMLIKDSADELEKLNHEKHRLDAEICSVQIQQNTYEQSGQNRPDFLKEMSDLGNKKTIVDDRIDALSKKLLELQTGQEPWVQDRLQEEQWAQYQSQWQLAQYQPQEEQLVQDRPGEAQWERQLHAQQFHLLLAHSRQQAQANPSQWRSYLPQDQSRDPIRASQVAEVAPSFRDGQPTDDAW